MSEQDQEQNNQEQNIPRTTCTNCEETIRYPERLGGKRGICKYCSHEQILPPIEEDDQDGDEEMMDTQIMMSTPASPKKKDQSEEETYFLFQCTSCKRVFRISGWLHEKVAICNYCEHVQRLERENWNEALKYPRDAKNQDPIQISSFPNWMSTTWTPDFEGAEERSTFVAVLTRERKTPEASNTVEAIYYHWKNVVEDPYLLWRDLRWSVYFLFFGILLIGGYVFYSYNSISQPLQNPSSSTSAGGEPPRNHSDSLNFTPPPEALPKSHIPSPEPTRKQHRQHIQSMALLLALEKNPIHFLFRIPPDKRRKSLIQSYRRSWRFHFQEPLDFQPPSTIFPPPGTTTNTPDIWMEVFSTLAARSDLDPYTRNRALHRLRQRLLLVQDHFSPEHLLDTDKIPWILTALKPSLKAGFRKLLETSRSSEPIVKNTSRSILTEFLTRHEHDSNHVTSSLWLAWLLMNEEEKQQNNKTTFARRTLTDVFQQLQSTNRFRSRILSALSEFGPRETREQYLQLLLSYPRTDDHATFLRNQFKRHQSTDPDLLSSIAYFMSIPGWSEDQQTVHFHPVLRSVLQTIKKQGISGHEPALNALVQYSVMTGRRKLYREVRKAMYAYPWAVRNRLKQLCFVRFGDQQFYQLPEPFSVQTENFVLYSAMLRNVKSVQKNADHILQNFLTSENSRTYSQATLQHALWTHLLAKNSVHHLPITKITTSAFQKNQKEFAKLTFKAQDLHDRNMSLNSLFELYLRRYDTDRAIMIDQIQKQIFLQELQSGNAWNKSMNFIRSYEKNHGQDSRIRPLKKTLFENFRLIFPLQSQREIDVEHSEFHPSPDDRDVLIPGASDPAFADRKTWLPQLQQSLQPNQKDGQESRYLNVYLINPMEAQALLGKNERQIPAPIEKDLRKTRNLLRHIIRTQKDHQQTVQLSVKQRSTLQTIQPGEPIPNVDASNQTDAPLKIRTGEQWTLRLGDTSLDVTGDFLFIPEGTAHRNTSAWKLLRLQVH